MTARILLRDIYHLVIGDAAHTRERGVDLRLGTHVEGPQEPCRTHHGVPVGRHLVG